MKIWLKRALAPLAILGMVIALGGCVAYPAGPYPAGPYAGGPYYAAPAPEIILPPVYVGGGWGHGYGGGYGGGGGHWH